MCGYSIDWEAGLPGVCCFFLYASIHCILRAVPPLGCPLRIKSHCSVLTVLRTIGCTIPHGNDAHPQRHNNQLVPLRQYLRNHRGYDHLVEPHSPAILRRHPHLLERLDRLLDAEPHIAKRVDCFLVIPAVPATTLATAPLTTCEPPGLLTLPAGRSQPPSHCAD